MAKQAIDWTKAKPWIPSTVFLDPTQKDPNPANVTFEINGETMLKITDTGFWVRGQQVPQDAKEAQEVYSAFREWLTWSMLTRKY